MEGPKAGQGLAASKDQLRGPAVTAPATAWAAELCPRHTAHHPGTPASGLVEPMWPMPVPGFFLGAQKVGNGRRGRNPFCSALVYGF